MVISWPDIVCSLNLKVEENQVLVDAIGRKRGDQLFLGAGR
jgi:hypothetical protein